MTKIATVNSVLEPERKTEPFTGYVAVSHVLMQTEGFADFLFDNFQMVKDLSTSQDRLFGLNRFIMQSERFSEGYGQYKIMIERLANGELVIGSVVKVCSV
ncbi:hypothetical protein [Spirosoma aerophilum]